MKKKKPLKRGSKLQIKARKRKIAMMQAPEAKILEVQDNIETLKKIQWRKRTAAQHRQMCALTAYESKLNYRIETGQWKHREH